MIYIGYAAALPVLQRDWAMSATAAGTISASFQLAYALSLTGCSELADRIGARRVFLASTLASFAGTTAFALLVRGYWSCLLLYTLVALLLGGSYTTGIILIAENTPVARRGRAMGFFLAGHSLGLAVALVVTGLALPLGGYRLAFAAIALGPTVGAVAASAALRHTPNRVTPRGVVMGLGLLYAFAALGDSPLYSAAITEVVEPAYRGAALGLRSFVGYGAGAIAPLVFGAIIDRRGGVDAGPRAWGWAFASLGVSGLLAVASVMMLHRLAEARALTRGFRAAR